MPDVASQCAVYDCTTTFSTTEGTGVQSTSCLLSPFSDPDTTDLVPVEITSIDIVELGQDVSVLVRDSITGRFSDGDSFVYESIINTPADVNGANDIPRVLQMNIVGLNQLNEEIINVFIITYSNTCGDYPVLFEGQTIGWTILVGSTPCWSIHRTQKLLTLASRLT